MATHKADGATALSAREQPATDQIDVTLPTDLPADVADYARLRLGGMVLEVLGGATPIRVRLSIYPDPAVHFPVVAQANAQPPGRPVRAQARGATAREAIDLLQARLRHQLRQALGTDDSDTMPPNPVALPLPRRPDDSAVVRRKLVPFARLTVDEAVREMRLRDYDFHLFTEIGSDQDSVVYGCGPDTLRLAQLVPLPERLAPHAVRIVYYDRPAPVLSVPEATDMLRLSEVRFTFFRDAHSGRGSALYRRNDGHFGLLTAE